MRTAHDPVVSQGVPSGDRRQRAGRAIRQARERRRWTATELADKLTSALQAQEDLPGRSQTVGQSTVSRWETGNAAPEPWKFPVIEQVLDIDPGTLGGLLYDRPLNGGPDVLAGLEVRVGHLEAKVDQMLALLRDLDRRIQGK